MPSALVIVAILSSISFTAIPICPIPFIMSKCRSPFFFSNSMAAVYHRRLMHLRVNPWDSVFYRMKYQQG